MEAGVLPMRNGGQKGLCVQEPHRALLGILLISEIPVTSCWLFLPACPRTWGTEDVCWENSPFVLWKFRAHGPYSCMTGKHTVLKWVMSVIVSGDLPAFAHWSQVFWWVSQHHKKICESQYMLHPGGMACILWVLPLRWPDHRHSGGIVYSLEPVAE